MIRLKELRLKAQLSQQELAKKAEIGQSTIHYIETGRKSPTYRILRKLASALGVSVSDLLGGD
ncbi:MAG: helix-turn-helix domain-containing protein [Moorellaceae bacterium]